jgi:ferric-dicitrate binding protein FerR (iron transport regulator)
MEADRIRNLAEKWLNGTISAEERLAFEDWYNRQPPGSIEWLSDNTEAELRGRIFQSIVDRIEAEDNQVSGAKIISVSRPVRSFRKIAVAAAIVVTAGAAMAWFFIGNRPSGHSQELSIYHSNGTSPALAAALPRLTLANGDVVPLDSLSAGKSLRQGDARISIEKDGVIVYRPADANTNALYNTLTVPHGSRLAAVQLSDGSKVWLNVGSSLRFPVVFAAGERKVTVSGEAYFEVKKDARRRFVVESGSVTTEVLGTHFNVNAYNGQQETAVTLLEGSVKVSNPAFARVLQPGQQAGVQQDGTFRIAHPDLEAVSAWRNGQLKLSNAGIQTIMLQLSRWHDVDVLYEGHLEGMKFSGIISRETPLPQVLEMLSLTKEVGFRTEGRKITVYSLR